MRGVEGGAAIQNSQIVCAVCVVYDNENGGNDSQHADEFVVCAGLDLIVEKVKYALYAGEQPEQDRCAHYAVQRVFRFAVGYFRPRQGCVLQEVVGQDAASPQNPYRSDDSEQSRQIYFQRGCPQQVESVQEERQIVDVCAAKQAA